MEIIKKPDIRKIVLEKFDSKCSYCGLELTLRTLQIDHIKPKRRHIKGYYGKCEIENFNPSCGSCNSSKGSLDLEIWRNELSLKKERIIRDSSTFRSLQRFGLVEFTNKPVVFYFEKIKNNG